MCPVISYASQNVTAICRFYHTDLLGNGLTCGIAFEKRMELDLLSLYNNGDLRIMNVLSQDALVAKKPTIKCHIIEARNALRLHEIDLHYFYKPDVITEDYIGVERFYKMVFNVPEDYTIPKNFNFTFTEFCFGNKWSLYWSFMLKKLSEGCQQMTV